jgi:hypothetical protein
MACPPFPSPDDPTDTPAGYATPPSMCRRLKYVAIAWVFLGAIGPAALSFTTGGLHTAAASPAHPAALSDRSYHPEKPPTLGLPSYPPIGNL